MNAQMNLEQRPSTMDRMLSVHDVAKRLGISTRQIWKLVKLGQVPAQLKIARSARWRNSDIASFIANGCRLPNRV